MSDEEDAILWQTIGEFIKLLTEAIVILMAIDLLVHVPLCE